MPSAKIVARNDRSHVEQAAIGGWRNDHNFAGMDSLFDNFVTHTLGDCRDHRGVSIRHGLQSIEYREHRPRKHLQIGSGIWLEILHVEYVGNLPPSAQGQRGNSESQRWRDDQQYVGSAGLDRGY